MGRRGVWDGGLGGTVGAPVKLIGLWIKTILKMSNYNKNNRSKTFDNKSSINMFNKQPSVFNTQAPLPQTNGFSTQQPSVFNAQAPPQTSTFSTQQPSVFNTQAPIKQAENKDFKELENKINVLTSMVQELQNKLIPKVNTIHTGIHCDMCKKSDIVGLRYKCMYCADYDLCQDCWNTPTIKYSHEHKAWCVMEESLGSIKIN